MISKNRDSYFDNAKLLLIILVVIGHSVEQVKDNSSLLSSLYTLIYLFHMPCFSFISGYFAKYSKNTDKHAMKFLRLYIIMQTVYYLVMKTVGYEVEFRYSKPYWTYWYLLSSSIWYLMIPLVKDVKGILGASFVIAVLAGYDNGFSTTLSMSRVLVFFPYFLLGYYAKRETLMSIKHSRVKYVILGLCLIFSAVIIKNNPIIDAQLYGKEPYDEMGFTQWYAGIYRVCVYILSVLYGVVFFAFVPSKKTCLSKLGSQTLIVYLTHGLLIKILCHYEFFKHVNSPHEYAILILLCGAYSVVVSYISLSIKQYKLKHS